MGWQAAAGEDGDADRQLRGKGLVPQSAPLKAPSSLSEHQPASPGCSGQHVGVDLQPSLSQAISKKVES